MKKIKLKPLQRCWCVIAQFALILLPMKVKEFLKGENLSVGDNAYLLLDKLGFSQEEYLRVLEAKIGESAKMSKSKGNIVDPEEVINKYGADTIRLYILFAGPVEKDFEWTEEGVNGAYRFLRRFWSYFHQYLEEIRNVSYNRDEFIDIPEKAKKLRYRTHQTLQRYLTSMEELSFNTAIASVMELLNELQDFKPEITIDYKVLRESLEIILFMLYPITPHICEELWQSLGNEKPITYYTFPQPDERALIPEEIEIPVQINGKLRGIIKVGPNADEETVKEKALKDPKISQWLEGKNIKKVIYIKNKLLSVVV